MAAKKRLNNIAVYHKKIHLNIGVFIFGIIFIYLIAMILMYLTNQHVTAYEVREGSILKDTAYTGFVVRTEQVVAAPESGYVNYFPAEGSKVGGKTNVYTLSSSELQFKDSEEDEAAELSTEEQESLLVKTQSFSENFKEEDFQDVYTLKDTIISVLESKSSQSRKVQLTDMLENEGADLTVYNGTTDGIIVYSVDGYEDVDVNHVTEEMLSKQDYEKVSLKNNQKVSAGDPVYKLITDDTWSVVIPLSEQTAGDLADTTRVKVRFTKDNETDVADFEIVTSEGSDFGVLTFDAGMIRYAEERYLDIELILEDESGLKIPKSSVVEKAFYIVPEDYLTQGGNSKTTGVLLDDGGDTAVFQSTDVYYRDNETGMVYLDPNSFEEGDTLIKPDSEETYRLEETKTLKGVYNINKGYAVFKQIQILCESEEYYVVASGSDYGLSNYDHIALDGSIVNENDIVF